MNKDFRDYKIPMLPINLVASGVVNAILISKTAGFPEFFALSKADLEEAVLS